jgi:hypothetical protein
MKTKKAMIIYISISYFWLSLASLVIVYFQGVSIISIFSGALALSLLVRGVKLLSDISTPEVQFNQGKLILTMMAMLSFAILEILAWYTGQNRILVPKIYGVLGISGLGLVAITFVFLAFLGFQYYLGRDS